MSTQPPDGQVVSLAARRPTPPSPPSPPVSWRALGCPVQDCVWRSRSFPVTGHHDARAVNAFLAHVYQAHPRYRQALDQARAQVEARKGAAP